jgi:hypothetical protein
LIYESQYATIDSFTNKKIRNAIDQVIIPLKTDMRGVSPPVIDRGMSYAADGRLRGRR